MRVPRVRFTVRRMMVAVAVLAFLMVWAAHLMTYSRTPGIRSVAYRKEMVTAATLSMEAARSEAALACIRADLKAAGGREKARLEQLVVDSQGRVAGLRREADRALRRAAQHARWEQMIEDTEAFFPWRSAVGAMGVAVCGVIVMRFSAASR